MIKTIQNIVNHYIVVYLTPFPYILYNEANKHGNIVFAGVGLGLIQCQQTVWVSNAGMVIVFYNSSNMYYSNQLLCMICLFLYGFSFSKSYYLVSHFLQK
jgi:hypothetical protein